MNKKQISTLLTQAITALEGAVSEMNREECQCTRLQREAEQRARKAAQKKQNRFCKCMNEFGPIFAPPVPPRPVARPLPPRDTLGRFVSTQTPFGCAPAPKPQWGVTGQPKEDNNKVFGIKIQVDEPRVENYNSRWAFERDHEKFDRLVDAAEACTWGTKATENTPLHKVNAIRRRVEDGPVMGVNLVGESHWF